MRNLALLLFIIVSLVGCRKDNDDPPEPADGRITLSLDIEIIEKELAQDRVAANTDTFKVVVELESGVEVVAYENASEVPEFISLEPGSYIVKAFSKNANQSASFDSPYYYGESNIITLGPGETENVSITCNVGNCGVRIIYSSNVIEQFDSYSTEVSNASGTLTYIESETRIGFFDLSPIAIEATLNYETADGTAQTRTLTGTIEEPVANKLYEIQLDASTSRLSINIVLDEVMITESLIINDYTSPCVTDGYALDELNPFMAGEVIGLCFGVETAEWVQPDGSSAPANSNYSTGHGIIESFGSNVPSREGSNMLLLSTGTARLPIHPEYLVDLDKGYTSTVPALGTFYTCTTGSENLDNTSSRNDGIGLKLTINVPPTAIGFSFDHKYYTKDELTDPLACSLFYDESAVIVNPIEGGIAALPAGGNVTFDASGNTISTVSDMEVCFGCVLGDDELEGTGFENRFGTRWNTTTVPLTNCTKFDITFAIWDNGDGIITSSVLYDNFQWIYEGTVDLVTVASSS